MNFKIINFDKTERNLKNERIGELLTISDYFQWYLSGIEDIINDNPNSFVMTDRYDNERTENISYNFYENENVSDVLVLLNNDNYLFDAPADWDLLQDITDNKLNYYKKQNKVHLTPEEEKYWRNKLEEQSVNAHEAQKRLIIPIRSELQRTIRLMNEYIESREVK